MAGSSSFRFQLRDHLLAEPSPNTWLKIPLYHGPRPGTMTHVYCLVTKCNLVQIYHLVLKYIKYITIYLLGYNVISTISFLFTAVLLYQAQRTSPKVGT